MLKPARRRVLGVVLLVAAAAALAGTLGSLGHLAWWLELFSHFRPQYAAALAACGVVLAAMRRFGVALATLALAMANGLPMLHYLAPEPPQPPAAQAELRAVLLNLYLRNRDHEAVREYVRSLEPDIAVFLEVTPAWREVLRGLSDLLPYQASAGEVLVAARAPLMAVRALTLSPGDATATAIGFRVAVADTQLAVIGTHVNWPLGPGISASRNLELAALADMARTADGPVVILGDLNLTAFSPFFDYVLARGRLVDCAAGRGWHPTWPARFPPLYLQIDHCLASAGVAISAFGTGPYVGSDHYPLEVTLRLPGPGAQVRPALRASTARPTFRR